MILKRCGWHRKYFGRSRFLGWVSLRPFLRLQWSDGMCAACAERFSDDRLRVGALVRALRRTGQAPFEPAGDAAEVTS